MRSNKKESNLFLRTEVKKFEALEIDIFEWNVGLVPEVLNELFCFKITSNFEFRYLKMPTTLFKRY